MLCSSFIDESVRNNENRFHAMRKENNPLSLFNCIMKFNSSLEKKREDANLLLLNDFHDDLIHCIR